MSSKNLLETPNQEIEINTQRVKGIINTSNVPSYVNNILSYHKDNTYLFYFIILLFISVIYYITYNNSYYNKTNKTIELYEELDNKVKKINTYVVGNTIKVYNYIYNIPLENIIVIDILGNVIDINIDRSRYVKHYNIGQKNGTNIGDLYIIDLKSNIYIKEIILMINPDVMDIEYDGELGTGYTIDIYDDNTKNWTHSGIINHKENHIPIYDIVPLSEEEIRINNTNSLESLYDLPCDNMTDKEVLMYNESRLALKLKEDGQDEYWTY